VDHVTGECHDEQGPEELLAEAGPLAMCFLGFRGVCDTLA
jgi:hypothetical protein